MDLVCCFADFFYESFMSNQLAVGLSVNLLNNAVHKKTNSLEIRENF